MHEKKTGDKEGKLIAFMVLKVNESRGIIGFQIQVTFVMLWAVVLLYKAKDNSIMKKIYSKLKVQS